MPLPRSAGEPCTCREKIGPRPIFKIFSLDQIRVDQEKKEVYFRKRRASIYRTLPSAAVDYFLVSHVIMGIVVIEFVISKNRRLGAISTTLNGHLLETVAWSSSLSSTPSSRNVKTAASFCRCTTVEVLVLAVTVRVRSIILASVMGLFPSAGWFVCCSFWSWSCSAGPVCVHVDRRIDREGGCLVSSWKSKKQSSLLFCPATMYFFRGPAGSPSVSLWSCGRSARSIAADDDGKTFAATFTTATGLARGSATLTQVLANDEASEPTRIRKTRVLLVDRTVGEVLFMVCASCFETVGFHCMCCP